MKPKVLLAAVFKQADVTALVFADADFKIAQIEVLHVLFALAVLAPLLHDTFARKQNFKLLLALRVLDQLAQAFVKFQLAF